MEPRRPPHPQGPASTPPQIRRAWPDDARQRSETSGTWTFSLNQERPGSRLLTASGWCSARRLGGLLNARRRHRHVRQALLDVLGSACASAVADGTGLKAAPRDEGRDPGPTVTAELPRLRRLAATAPHPRRQPRPTRHRPAAPANASDGRGRYLVPGFPGDQNRSGILGGAVQSHTEPEPPEGRQETPPLEARAASLRRTELCRFDDSAVSADRRGREALGEVGAHRRRAHWFSAARSSRTSCR